jgi:hypothetical protein
MLKKLLILALILFGYVTYAWAEEATELFIPIGQSPGLSGKYTVQGTIEIVVPEIKTIVVTSGDKSYMVKIDRRTCAACDDGTLIFLDRSKAKLRNDYGYFKDLEVGSYVEVKFEDNLPSRPAEWVKIERGR